MRHSVKLMFPDVPQLVKMPSLTFKSQIFQPYLKSEEHISTPLLSVHHRATTIHLIDVQHTDSSPDKLIRASVSVHVGGSDSDIWQKLNLIKSSTTSAPDLCFIRSV